MDKMIAHCGLNCTDCPAYTATQANDMDALARVAAQWQEEFNAPEITAASIQCDGCLATTGRLSGYCSMCQIRACATDMDVANCAHCADYGCETLSGFLKHAPQAQATLEEIRRNLAA